MTTVLTEAVIRVKNASRDEFVIKQHRNRAMHEREVHAYRHWTATLGPSAPVFAAVDDAAMIIATSVVPGASPDPDDLTPDVYRQAGVLLRRFHEAESPAALPWYQDWLRERAAHWASRGRAAADDG
ncbi:MAG TPA: hypothetical protein VGI96_22205 [Streptosporangiaceae bacterium]